MKKLFLAIMGLMALSVGAFATTSGTLDHTTAENTSVKVMNLIFLGAKVVGAIVIIMGIIELLVEKDQGGQQGKKVTGAMKLGGGVLLLLAASVISWMVGSGDATQTKSIIKMNG